MFYTEEDVQPAVDMAVQLFGTVGNISNEKITLKNVIITSNKFGHLWYGDIDDSNENVLNKCASISQKFEMQVTSINMV